MDYSAFLVPVVTIITSQIIVIDLARFRVPFKKLLLFLALELLVQAAVSGSILSILGYDEYVKWFIITVDLPAIITFFLLSKRRDSRDLFTIMVTVFISIAISLPSIALAHLIKGYYNYYNLIRIIIFILLFPVLHFFIRKSYRQLQDELEKGWLIFCTLPFIGFLFLYYQYFNYSIGGNNTVMMMNSATIILIMIVVFWVLHYVFKQLHEKYMVQEQQRILSMQNKAQLDQFEQQKEMSEKMNRRWHDLRHSTQELIELLESGNSYAALAYLKEQRGIVEVPKTDYCLHQAVNSILCLWAERSRKAGIDVEIQTDVPEKLEIDPMELSALFANAFENAYEGCLRLPEHSPKFIKVEAHYNGKRLAVGFSNSCLDDIRFDNDLPVSLKSNGGIGTRSMAYTVLRFHGTSYFGVKDNTFSARFVLNI